MTNESQSGTPLARKLGIKPRARVHIAHAPANFESRLDLPGNVRVMRRLTNDLDVIVFFAASRTELAKRFPALRDALAIDGRLWIAWPKRASGVASNLDFSFVQQTGLDSGLVDNKSAAIDDVYTGLQFVYRLSDRPTLKSSRRG